MTRYSIIQQVLRLLLAPLAPLYRLIIYTRNFIFDHFDTFSISLPIPVISIGNLTTGGTGKTPLTLYLAQEMTKLGIVSTIISRGYGGQNNNNPVLVNYNSNPSHVGDEPLMMARKLTSSPVKIIICRKKYKAALLALSFIPKPKILILDDGFQHRHLKRNTDLLLLDGINTFKNTHLLPLGNLREPMSSASRASCLIVTRSRYANKQLINNWWNKYGSDGPIFWTDFYITSLRNFTSNQVTLLKNNKVKDKLFAFCAIGNHDAFFSDLKLANITLTGTYHFPDHHFFTSDQLRQVNSMANNLNSTGLVCTEKDYIKISTKNNFDLPVWIAEQSVVSNSLLIDWLLKKNNLYQHK